MHNDLVMFKGKYTLNKMWLYLSFPLSRYVFPSGQFTFSWKNFVERQFGKSDSDFVVVKPLLNWTFFVFSIHNVRPSNLFCCLSLFKASTVWKILMTLSKQQVSFGIFSQSFFASLPNIYYWVSFITNCISWQPILAQNSRDEVSWEFEQNPHFFNIEVILFDINALILQDFYLMYITFCVKLILWVLTSLTIGIKSRSTLYYVLLFSFDLWQNPEFLFVCLVAESTTDSATRLDIGILPNHTETNTNK